MQTSSHSSNLTLRVVYEVLPDLIEVETSISVEKWSGVASAYTSPDDLAESAKKLALWAENPQGEQIVEAGADTGIGWLRLRFYCADLAGHVVCQVQMATNASSGDVRRLVLKAGTEPGLIIRFATHLESVARTLKGEAVLAFLE